MLTLKSFFLVVLGAFSCCGFAQSQTGATTMPAPSFRKVHLDDQGVIRWSDTNEEVALFGVNYCLPSASDYRAAGYVKADRKKLIDVDMAHLARMGFNGIRVCLWGDYQNSDEKGNLVENDHLDLMDYLIARARERGMSILFSPIVTHSSQWPDLMSEKAIGFSEHFQKNELGTNPQAIAAQVNYLRQLMDHVNPYTGVALKDEPSILFIELVNEPWHHSRDVEGSIAYINALADAVGAGKTDKLLFFNLTQDFGMAGPINRSKVQGYTFGWYPNGLVSGHTRRGNFLRHVDSYAELRKDEIANRPRIVYEFDAADMLAPYLYPAMVRTFRTGGVQFAAMFSYDMLETAPYNLGWQTHYFNLVYTPKRAIGAVIAAEAMKRLPRLETYGDYPRNTRFGDFRISYEEDLAELVTENAFIHAGDTKSTPPDVSKLIRVAGCGSSPVVQYEGTGSYFLDKVTDGVWRLEVYPDAVEVSDPFEKMSPDKVVTRVIHREWPMQVRLPDLGSAYHVRQINTENAPTTVAVDGALVVKPGVYLLSKNAEVNPDAIPASIRHLGFREYHAPAPQVLPRGVRLLDETAEHVVGTPFRIAARVMDVAAPDKVMLWVRRLGSDRFQSFSMTQAGAYEYAVDVPADVLKEGVHEYCVSVETGGAVETFPGRIAARPTDWNFFAKSLWTIKIVDAETSLRLLQPTKDYKTIAITRPGDPMTELVVGSTSRESALRIVRPLRRGWAAEDTTASVYVGDRIQSRTSTIDRARSLRLRARASVPGTVLHVTLVETDGTSWAGRVRLQDAWGDVEIRMDAFQPARGVLLPQAFPNLSAYWIAPAEGRGNPGDSARLSDIENLQFSLRQLPGDPAPIPVQVDIESVELTFK